MCKLEINLSCVRLEYAAKRSRKFGHLLKRLGMYNKYFFYIKCNIPDDISLILAGKKMYEKEINKQRAAATPIKPPKRAKETSHLISSHVSERDGVLPSLQKTRLFPAMVNHDSNFSILLTCQMSHPYTLTQHTLLQKNPYT
jgi:hypothetical protein